MNQKKYDIFISYRRKDAAGNIAGRDIARGFKHYLESKGFTCFFDYSECDDGEFEDIIIPAVRNSKYFLLVMTNGALDKCIEEGDWVRREISEAWAAQLKIIPIAITDNEHPEISFRSPIPSLPYPLNRIEKIQWAEVSMGSLYEVSVDELVRKRLNDKKINVSKQGKFIRCIKKKTGKVIRLFKDRFNVRRDFSKKKKILIIISVFVSALLITYIYKYAHNHREIGPETIDLFQQNDSAAKYEVDSLDSSIVVKDTSSDNCSQTISSKEPSKSDYVVKKESEEELYNKAMNNNDWALLKKLADKGYVLAYLPLAKHYLKDSRTHDLAYRYAKKAQQNGQKGAEAILDTLKLYDYY